MKKIKAVWVDSGETQTYHEGGTGNREGRAEAEGEGGRPVLKRPDWVAAEDPAGFVRTLLLLN